MAASILAFFRALSSTGVVVGAAWFCRSAKAFSASSSCWRKRASSACWSSSGASSFSSLRSWARSMAASILAFFRAPSSAAGIADAAAGLAVTAASRACWAAVAALRSWSTWACISGVAWAASCFSAFFSATWAMLASILNFFSSSLRPAGLAAGAPSSVPAGASAWAALARAAFSARALRSASFRSSAWRRRS